MTTILTTTGISLYLNTKREYKTDAPTDDQMRQFLRDKPEAASAEANSLLQMAESDDNIVFLPTDTPMAEKCADLLRDFFIGVKGFKPFQIRVEKLQFRDDEEHIETQGLRNLVNTLVHEIELAEQAQEEVVINATPGFKLEIVYSTMIGMLNRVPIKYMHEKFRRVVTLNPIALDWDTSLFLAHKDFFDWLDEAKPQKEVETRLKGQPDRERIVSFLTAPDDKDNIFLSPLGEVLQLRFHDEAEAAEKAEWPPEVQVKNIKDKIAKSICKARTRLSKVD